MTEVINSYQPAISAITEIELLCWKTATAKDVTVLNNFVLDCIVFELEREVKLKTIELRKTYSIKLADAIIAATAIVMDLTLITNDKRGFNKLHSLKVLNPDLAK